MAAFLKTGLSLKDVNVAGLSYGKDPNTGEVEVTCLAKEPGLIEGCPSERAIPSLTEYILSESCTKIPEIHAKGPYLLRSELCPLYRIGLGWSAGEKLKATARKAVPLPVDSFLGELAPPVDRRA